MNTENALAPARLDQLIATLLAVLGASVRFALAVLQECAAVKARVVEALRICEQEGWALRCEGEDDATAEARMKYIAWIARDPRAARRRMVRGLRGWEAHRYAHCMPVLCLPPPAMGDVLADACGFEAALSDTS